jgi:hypothetical protein
MKKKAYSFSAVLILLGCAYWYCSHVYGWMVFRKNTDTPKEYMNHVKIKAGDYTKDSIALLEQLKILLVKHKDFFYSNAYFDSTILIIDSILYSPDYNKLAVLLITKNPTYRQLVPDKSNNWYYDATCYLGVSKMTQSR